MYKSPIIACITILMLLVPGLSGCGKKTEAVAPKSNVVSQKIAGEQKKESKTVLKEQTADKVSDKSAVEEKKTGGEPSEIATEHTQEGRKSESGKNAEAAEKVVAEKAESQEAVGSAAEPADPKLGKEELDSPEDKKMDDERRKAAELLANIHQEASMNNGGGENRLDSLTNPFLPLFGDAPVAPKKGRNRPKKPAHELTPIEKVDLSQLKLVATLRASSGNKALVEDSTGKGYVVDKGTPIGINSGSVVEITNNSLVVEEEIETLTGDIKVQRREIKLQKAPGE